MIRNGKDDNEIIIDYPCNKKSMCTNCIKNGHNNNCQNIISYTLSWEPCILCGKKNNILEGDYKLTKYNGSIVKSFCSKCKKSSLCIGIDIEIILNLNTGLKPIINFN